MEMPKDMSQARRMVTQLYGQVDELRDHLALALWRLNKFKGHDFFHQSDTEFVQDCEALLTKYRGENGKI